MVRNFDLDIVFLKNLLPLHRYVIEIGIPFLAFAPVRILRVFVYCSEVREGTYYFFLEQEAVYSLFNPRTYHVAKESKQIRV